MPAVVTLGVDKADLALRTTKKRMASSLFFSLSVTSTGCRQAWDTPYTIAMSQPSRSWRRSQIKVLTGDCLGTGKEKEKQRKANSVLLLESLPLNFTLLCLGG